MYYTGAVCFADFQISLQNKMFPRSLAGLFA